MTCIVAVAENGVVTIGADSAGVGGGHICVRRDPKIYRVGEFVIGFTSSFRMGQLIGYKFSPPDHIDEITVEQYMNTLFVDGVRAVMKDGGYAKTRDGAEEGGTFIVAYKGRIFTIFDDYQVAENSVSYAAVGSGYEVALGSLFTSVGSPSYRVQKALEAASYFCTGVCGPFMQVEA